MNRVDKIVALVVVGFIALGLLRAALNVAAEMAVFVAFLGAVYAGVRLWRAGKLDFLKSSKTTEPAGRQ